MKWEMSKIVSLNTVCKQINDWSRIAQIGAPPVIVLFGPDCDHKYGLEDIFTAEIYALAVCREVEFMVDFDKLRAHRRVPVMVVLSGKTSAKHEARHRIIKAIGTAVENRSIIGIYAKARAAAPGHFDEITLLEKSPPTPDGLTELITVTED